MRFIKFAIRRIFRHWRLYIFVLVGFALISGLLAGLPVYSEAIAFQSLKKSIENEQPIERNFEVKGATSVLTSGLWGYVTDIIGDLVTNKLEVRTTVLGAHVYNPIISSNANTQLRPNYIKVFSMDKLSSYSKLVEGKWPEFKPPYTQSEILKAMTQPPDIEAVIGLNVSRESGIKIGDIIVDNSGRHFPIVGLVEPYDPKDDAWWGDSTTFNIYRKPGLNEDTIFLSLIVHQNNLREYYPQHDASWRLLVNHGVLNPDSIVTVEQRIINFKGRIEANKASMQTNLPNLLEKYREDIKTTRTVILLLSLQSLIFILYGLLLTESLIIERAQTELATMVGRGSGPLQLVTLMSTEGLILTVIAGLLIGPLLAGSLLFVWSQFSGIKLYTIWSFSGQGYSMLGAGIGWLVLTFGTFTISRRNILSWQRRQSRSEKQMVWQKYYFDLFMILFSGLTYWQLSTTGSFVMDRVSGTDLADPLLLISPTLFLLSISLVFLRIYPAILSFLSKIFYSVRGIVIPLSIKKLSRDPRRPSQMILLISIAASVTLFSYSYEHSLLVNQESISHYIVGADIRIAQQELPLENIASLPGVIEVTRVFRHVTQLRTGSTLTILGIDPMTFPKVTSYPMGMTNITIQAIADVLLHEVGPGGDDQTGTQAEGDIPTKMTGSGDMDVSLPAIFSYSAIPPNLGIGDQTTYTIQSISLNYKIRGVIKNFPAVEGRYIVTDLTRLAHMTNLERPEYYADFELWMTVDPARYSEIISRPFIQENIISDTQQELRTLQENAYIQGAIGAFKLNTFILGILSTMIFSLLIYSSGQNRKYEYGILQAEGLSSSQLIYTLLMEGMIIIVLGIFIGIIIGVGLSYMMRPYLNVALMRSFPQMIVYKILFDWKQIAFSNALLILCYLISLGLVTWQLIKIGIHQILRTGDE